MLRVIIRVINGIRVAPLTWRGFAALTWLLVSVSWGCGEDRDSAGTATSGEEGGSEEAVSAPLQELAPRPSPDHRIVDLRGAGSPGMAALGMNVADARPPLTASCVSDHYAERLGERFLRLSCKVDGPGLGMSRLRMGFAERPESTRLAFLIEERQVHEHAVGAWLGIESARVGAQWGPPNSVTPPGSAFWTGESALDGTSTSMELQARDEGDRRWIVSVAYRHHTLMKTLGDPW